jgi:hypothetical protein
VVRSSLVSRILTWPSHRLAGPPITQESLVTALLKAGVNVAIGVVDEAYARNTRFEAGWVCLIEHFFLCHIR